MRVGGCAGWRRGEERGRAGPDGGSAVVGSSRSEQGTEGWAVGDGVVVNRAYGVSRHPPASKGRGCPGEPGSVAPLPLPSHTCLSLLHRAAPSSRLFPTYRRGGARAGVWQVCGVRRECACVRWSLVEMRVPLGRRGFLARLSRRWCSGTAVPRDCYAELGVPRAFAVDAAALRTTYRRLMAVCLTQPGFRCWPTCLTAPMRALGASPRPAHARRRAGAAGGRQPLCSHHSRLQHTRPAASPR